MRVLLMAIFLLPTVVLFSAEAPLWVTPGTWGTVYFGYQNAAKEWVIPPRFSQAKSFGTGDVAPVKEHDRWKVIDRSGKTVFSFGDDWSIADIDIFSDGVAAVTIGTQGFSRFVDRNGKVIGDTVTYAGYFSEGLGAFSNYATPRKEARFGYLDRTGKVEFTPRFRWAGPFINGMASVIYEDGSAWFIDKNGVGKTRVDGVELLLPVREGLALALAIGGAWGYVDPKGAQAIPFQYLEARSFFGGLAAVKIAGSHPWGYIDRTGKVAIPHQFDSIESFENGRAWVVLNGDRCAINPSGAVVWSMKAEIPATMTSPKDYLPPAVATQVAPPAAPPIVPSGGFTWDTLKSMKAFSGKHAESKNAKGNLIYQFDGGEESALFRTNIVFDGAEPKNVDAIRVMYLNGERFLATNAGTTADPKRKAQVALEGMGKHFNFQSGKASSDLADLVFSLNASQSGTPVGLGIITDWISAHLSADDERRFGKTTIRIAQTSTPEGASIFTGTLVTITVP